MKQHRNYVKAKDSLFTKARNTREGQINKPALCHISFQVKASPYWMNDHIYKTKNVVTQYGMNMNNNITWNNMNNVVKSSKAETIIEIKDQSYDNIWISTEKLIDKQKIIYIYIFNTSSLQEE